MIHVNPKKKYAWTERGGGQPEWADLLKSQSPTQDLANFPPESVCMLLGQAWASLDLSTTSFRMLHLLRVNSKQEQTLLVVLKS